MSIEFCSAVNLNDTPMDIPVNFEYLGHKGSLQVMYRGRPRRVSHMRIGFVGDKPFSPAGFARLVSKPPFDLLVNAGGWTPVTPEDPRLDAGFMLFASTPRMAAELQEPKRTAAFFALSQELGGFPVGITFGRSLLQVDKVCYSDRPQDQLRLIYRVIDLLEVLVGIPARKVGLIAAGAPPPIDISDAICQVCLNALSVRVVYCDGCVTPHHKECWDYLGGCSTYACLRRTYRAHADEFAAIGDATARPAPSAELVVP